MKNLIVNYFFNDFLTFLKVLLKKLFIYDGIHLIERFYSNIPKGSSSIQNLIDWINQKVINNFIKYL